MLAHDPHTAKFISTELARHFVSDNPPPALVDRMAKNYEATGGDIRSVMRTMIYSPEFWSQRRVPRQGEDALRACGKHGARVERRSARSRCRSRIGSARMGEPLFLCQPPTGYSDKAETWVNTGALLNRLNFALGFAGDQMAGAQRRPDATCSATTHRKTPNAALDKSHSTFSWTAKLPQSTRATLEARLNDPQIRHASLDDPVKQVNEGLIAGPGARHAGISAALKLRWRATAYR